MRGDAGGAAGGAGGGEDASKRCSRRDAARANNTARRVAGEEEVSAWKRWRFTESIMLYVEGDEFTILPTNPGPGRPS